MSSINEIVLNDKRRTLWYNEIRNPLSKEFSMNIIPLFCEIDDVLQVYEKQIAQRQLPIPDQPKKRGCPRKLHTSEVMTLLVAFHQSRYQTFKDY